MAKKTILVNNEQFVPFIDERKIQKRVKELGKKISSDYKDRVPIFIGVLNGSFVFFSDLIREITIDCEVDFLKLSSYGDAKVSSGNVHLLKDLNCQVMGRDIIIVEDIIDTGHTLDYITRNLIARQPASLKICTLLDKAERRQVDIPVDYTGFVIPDKFVFGYGLDLDEHFRNLPFIGVAKPEI